MRRVAAPGVLFLRARRAGWAVLLSVVLASCLLTSETPVPVPLFGTFTTTVFVWPVVATVPTALVLEAATAQWDRRSTRPMARLDTGVVLAVVTLGTLEPLVLRARGWTSALAVYVLLQAATVLTSRLLGDWAWMLTMGLGSLTVVNSPLVTGAIVTWADAHWAALTIAGGLVLVLSRTLCWQRQPAARHTG